MRELFHTHSTIFGVVASAMIVALVGAAVNWSPIAMLIAGIASILVFPRAFYGWTAAKALDAVHSQTTPPSGFGGLRGDQAEIGRRAAELEDAYIQARDGGLLSNGLPADPRAFEKIAEQEGPG
jgi:hypothetical protein